MSKEDYINPGMKDKHMRKDWQPHETELEVQKFLLERLTKEFEELGG